MSVHGLLAADIALNVSANSEKYAKWDAVVPSWHDIQQSMPLTWPPTLQSLLPPAAQQVFANQRKNFDRDWNIVSHAMPFPPGLGCVRPSCSRHEYLYAWLLVNTRTFYYVTPQTKKLPKEDHMVLQPVADLFNHTDKDGCTVVYHPADSYSFNTTKSYRKGEEVYISYGPHHNDFLLVEYGFVLNANIWDEVRLDAAILPCLSQRQKASLEDIGFLGNYVLDKDTVCHRTHVALRLMLAEMHDSISIDHWHEFVEGIDDGEADAEKVDAVLVLLLRDYESTVADKSKALKSLALEADTNTLNSSRRATLLLRWGQISQLIKDTIKRIE